MTGSSATLWLQSYDWKPLIHFRMASYMVCKLHVNKSTGKQTWWHSPPNLTSKYYLWPTNVLNLHIIFVLFWGVGEQMHDLTHAKQAHHHWTHHLHGSSYQKTRIRILIAGPSDKSRSRNPELPATENHTTRLYTTVFTWMNDTSILDTRSLT